MGSPLSPVGACLYMEMKETDHFEKIMGHETTWMRYVDDIIVIMPYDTDLGVKLAELNQVDPVIQLTKEEEED